jgi:hypothetical protein
VPLLSDPVALQVAGIAGNRLLHDPNPPPGSGYEDIAELFGQCALRRFDRDVGA